MAPYAPTKKKLWLLIQEEEIVRCCCNSLNYYACSIIMQCSLAAGLSLAEDLGLLTKHIQVERLCKKNRLRANQEYHLLVIKCKL